MATTMTITAAESPMINDDHNERPPLLPLATLIGREIRSEKSDIPIVKYAHSNYVKRGEDLILAKTDCMRVEGDPSTSFSVFGIFDGHNGASAAIYSKEYLLDHVMSAVPQGLTREEWLETLPRALVAGFIKCDIDFQNNIREISGTTATFVVVDKWTVTAASVGDSRCILEVPGGEVTWLTVDHRLEDNEEEVNRVRASGGEVGRLNVCGNQGIGPLRCWPGGLCLSRSIGDMDVGEYIVPVPHVKQVKLPSSGGRLIIASDGIWDAINCEVAAKACHGLPTELAAKLVVKEALRRCGLKDDTTCLVVDIVPSDHNLKSVAPPPPPPPKKTAKEILSSFFRKWSHHDEGKNENKSTSEPVEQLFEEGSASLEIRLPRASSDPFRCAICQVQQTPNEDSLKDDDEEKSENDEENNGLNEMEKNENDESSNGSSQMEGPFLCTDCKKKKDMMEGKIKIRRKRPSKYK